MPELCQELTNGHVSESCQVHGQFIDIIYYYLGMERWFI